METTILATDDAHAINLAYERTQAGMRSRRPCRPVSLPAWLSRALTLPVIVNSEMVRTPPSPKRPGAQALGNGPCRPRSWPRSPQRCAAHPRDRGLAIARRGRGRRVSRVPLEATRGAWPGRRLGAARSRRGAAGSRPSRRSRSPTAAMRPAGSSVRNCQEARVSCGVRRSPAAAQGCGGGRRRGLGGCARRWSGLGCWPRRP